MEACKHPMHHGMEFHNAAGDKQDPAHSTLNGCSHNPLPAGGMFEIHARKSSGSLHVHPRGDLDGDSARELIDFIHDQYDGEEKIFIDTHDLGEISSHGSSVIRSRIGSLLGSFKPPPPPRVFFKGKKGLDIAPEGIRVLISPERRCGCGGPKGCGCAGGCGDDCKCKAGKHGASPPRTPVE